MGSGAGCWLRTEELAILVAQLATRPQDGMDVVAIEEPALKALLDILVVSIPLVDGQDEVDDLVPDVSR